MNLDLSLSLDLFIIGDLNNDLLNNNYNHLSRFMKQYNLNNAFIEPKHKVERITELINEIPIDLVCSGKSIDEMWILFKSSLIRIIDQI